MILSKADRVFLEELRGNTRDNKEFVRCSVMIMLSEGCPYKLIALSLGISLKTIQRYKKMYEEKGVDGLMEYRYTGREGKLKEDQVKQIKKELEEHLYANTEEIRIYVESEFGIQYSRSGIRDILHRIGYVYKKSKILPGKADSEKQEALVDELEELISTKTESEALFYIDGCHPTHKTRPCYGWIKKGKEHQLPSNTGRK